MAARLSTRVATPGEGRACRTRQSNGGTAVKALRLEGVTAGYGHTMVVRNVDLVVPVGKTVALLGANGAGKSTLLKTAAGLVRPVAGRLWLGDRRIAGLPAHARTRLGFCLIPEGHAIFREL